MMKKSAFAGICVCLGLLAAGPASAIVFAPKDVTITKINNDKDIKVSGDVRSTNRRGDPMDYRLTITLWEEDDFPDPFDDELGTFSFEWWEVADITKPPKVMNVSANGMATAALTLGYKIDWMFTIVGGVAAGGGPSDMDYYITHELEKISPVIPLPPAAALLIGGLAALATMARRRAVAL